MSWIIETRHALRALMRSRGYTAVAVATLALGIGANTAIFSFADAIVNRPFAFPGLRRIMAISAAIPRAGAERYLVSPADYADWVEQNRVFTRMAAYQGWPAKLTAAGEAQQVRGCLVSPGFFALLGIAPLQGRVFEDHIREDERYQVVASYGFWRQRLASDPAAVGKTIDLNGLDYTIVAVMPNEFDFPTYTEVWAPWIISPEQAKAERAAGTLNVVGRLRPGATPAQAGAQMSGIAAELARKYPGTNTGRGVNVMPLSEAADPYAIRYMSVMAAAVSLLLLLACANVANLQLARSVTRRREMALRVALGARPARIARQLFTEGILLSLAGAGMGLPLAAGALALVKRSIPQLVARHLPGLPFAELDARILGWLVVAAFAAGIAFTVPAVLQASPGRVHEILSEGGRGLVGSGGRRMRSVLVICEVALALVLLSAAGLLFRGFRNLAPTRQGFDPADVLTFRARAPQSESGEGPWGHFFEERLRRLGEAREIALAAAVSELPALGDSRSRSVAVEGQPAAPPENPLLAELRVASEDYFRTVGIPLLAGRGFTSHDGADAMRVAVISKAAARRFWPRQDPIGQRLQLAGAGRRTSWLTVIGIAGDVNYFFLDTDVRPTVYVPYRQYPVRELNVLVKPASGASQAAHAAREAMRRLDPSQPAYDLVSLRRFFSDLTGGVGVMAALLGAFAVLSLILSAAGIYAVVHYSVVQRRQEIGIRMAVGAHSSDIRNMVLRSSLQLAGIALGFGLPMAWALGRSMSRLMAGIVVLEPRLLAGAALLVVGTAMLASYLPARQATRVDPLVAIRSQ